MNGSLRGRMQNNMQWNILIYIKFLPQVKVL